MNISDLIDQLCKFSSQQLDDNSAASMLSLLPQNDLQWQAFAVGIAKLDVSYLQKNVSHLMEQLIKLHIFNESKQNILAQITICKCVLVLISQKIELNITKMVESMKLSPEGNTNFLETLTKVALKPLVNVKPTIEQEKKIIYVLNNICDISHELLASALKNKSIEARIIINKTNMFFDKVKSLPFYRSELSIKIDRYIQQLKEYQISFKENDQNQQILKHCFPIIDLVFRDLDVKNTEFKEVFDVLIKAINLFITFDAKDVVKNPQCRNLLELFKTTIIEGTQEFGKNLILSEQEYAVKIQKEITNKLDLAYINMTNVCFELYENGEYCEAVKSNLQYLYSCSIFVNTKSENYAEMRNIVNKVNQICEKDKWPLLEEFKLDSFANSLYLLNSPNSQQLGDVFIQFKDKFNRLKNHDKKIHQQTVNTLHRYLAKTYSSENKYEHALSCYLEIFQAKNFVGLDYDDVIKVFKATNKETGLISILSKALQEYPKNIEMLHTVCLLYKEQPNLNKAISLLAKYSINELSNKLIMLGYLIYIQNNQASEKTALQMRDAAKSMVSNELKQECAIELLKGRFYQEVIDLLDVPSNDTQMKIIRAIAFSKMKNFGKAEQIFDDCLRDSNCLSGIFLEVAYTKLQLKKYTEAIDYCVRYLQNVDSKDIEDDVFFLKGVSYFERGNKDDVDLVVENLEVVANTKNFPDENKIYFYLAISYLRKGVDFYDKSEKYLNKLTDENYKPCKTYFKIINSYKKEGDLPLAISKLEQLLKQKSVSGFLSDNICRYLTILYYKSESLEQAKKYFSKIKNTPCKKIPEIVCKDEIHSIELKEQMDEVVKVFESVKSKEKTNLNGSTVKFNDPFIYFWHIEDLFNQNKKPTTLLVASDKAKTIIEHCQALIAKDNFDKLDDHQRTKLRIIFAVCAISDERSFEALILLTDFVGEFNTADLIKYYINQATLQLLNTYSSDDVFNLLEDTKSLHNKIPLLNKITLACITNYLENNTVTETVKNPTTCGSIKGNSNFFFENEPTVDVVFSGQLKSQCK